MAVKEGMNNSAVATATYTINLPYSGDGYVRINSLSDLTDGAKVIIAARYNSTANAYYAMTAAASGRPTGVAFTSTTTDKGEELPATILNNESTYYWTVEATSDGFTFTNASDESLGYTTGTNFAIGGDNTEWTIALATSGANAMVSGYEGFYITNKNNDGRGVALNSSNNFGPYSTSNNNNSGYNFYLDIFVEGATPVTVPSISADDINIAYDATEGSIAYTLKNGVEGGVLRATTTADWLTIGTVGETIPFTCDANTETTERTATVTLTYTYGNENVTKDVTVTQAAAPAPTVVYTTIPALFEAATSTETEVQVTFDSWVVSGVSTNGRNVFVTDNDGHGFVIYYTSNMSSTFSAGDILSGNAVACSLKLYNGFAELLNLNVSDLTITDGGTVSEADIDMADLTGVNTGALVSYENLTCSVDNNKYYLSDGTTTLQVFNSLYAFEALEAGKTYNITGIYQQYNNTKEILPRSANDIVEVEVQHNPYTLTVSGLVNVNTYVFAGDENGMLFEGEGSAQIYDGTEVMISVDVEEGYVLESLMVDGVEHKADIDEGMYIFTMPTNDVTVTATAAESATYTLATSITSGKHYVIASGETDIEGRVKVMAGQNNNNRGAVEGTVSGTTLSVTSGATEFVIYGPDADGYYAIYDSANGYLYAASGSSNHLKSQQANNVNGKWSISFGNEGVSVVAHRPNGRNVMQYNATSDVFSCYASASQQPVYLYEKDDEAAPTETVHITDAKYATYCSENALDFSNTGLTAYIAKMNGSIVSFEPVTKVPAYSGVLLQADAAGDVTVGVATTVDDVTDNAFIGVIEATLVSEPGIFVLLNGDEGVGFYKTTKAFTVGAHTAYLHALPNGSRNFIGLNETTGISDVNRETITNNCYFDLLGRSVAQPTKGLYIVNGKKVVVK